jgi:hypothetical protein
VSDVAVSPAEPAAAARPGGRERRRTAEPVLLDALAVQGEWVVVHGRLPLLCAALSLDVEILYHRSLDVKRLEMEL